MGLFTLIAALLFSSCICLVVRKLRFGGIPQSKNSHALPRLERWPWLLGLDTLVTNVLDLRRHNASKRAQLRHERLGHTYEAEILGTKTIHTIDAANILAVTTADFPSFGKGGWARLIARYMGAGVLVNDDAEWHASRTFLRPFFRRNRVSDVSLCEKHVKNLIKYLDSNHDRFVDFRRAGQMVVLDITTEMLCGESSQSLSTSQRTTEPHCKLLDLIDKLEPYGDIAIELGPLSAPTFIKDYGKIMGMVKGIQDFFVRSIALAKEKTRAESDFAILHRMLGAGMTDMKTQGELQNIFFAAFDTSTALLTNLFDSILREPHVIKRLRKEIEHSRIGQDGFEDAKFSRLLYLRACIFETLRLHTPVTYHTRRTIRDTVLPRDHLGLPFPIKKGTVITWSIYAMNRRPDLYDNPNDFRPERWLKSDTATHDGMYTLISNDSFMPFGSGPRNCLGQSFALLLTSYIAARLLAEFHDVEVEDPEEPILEAAAVTYYNGNGTHVRFARL